MNKLTRTVLLCAASFILVGAALIFAVSRPADPAKPKPTPTEARKPARLDGKSGFVSTISAMREMFADLNEKDGIGDMLEAGYKMYAKDFSAVLVKDGNGYRIRSLIVDAAISQRGFLYSQRFEMRDGAVSSYSLLRYGEELSGEAPELMELAEKLDALAMNGFTEMLPGCDAYSIELSYGITEPILQIIKKYEDNGARATLTFEKDDEPTEMEISPPNYTAEAGGGIVIPGDALYRIAQSMEGKDAVTYEIWTDDAAGTIEFIPRDGDTSVRVVIPMPTKTPRQTRTMVWIVGLKKNEAGGYTGMDAVGVTVE